MAKKGTPKKLKTKPGKGYPVLMPNGKVDIMARKKHPNGPILKVKRGKRKSKKSTTPWSKAYTF